MITEQNAQRVLDALKADAQRTRVDAQQYLDVMSEGGIAKVPVRTAERYLKLVRLHHAYSMLNSGTHTVQPDHALSNALAVEQYVVGYVTGYDAPEWRDILSVIYLAATS